MACYPTGGRQQQLDRWGIFSLTDPELWDRVAWAVVFGGSGSEAILVTRPGAGSRGGCSGSRVYSVGTNSSGCLGLGDAQSCLAPTEIDALRGVDLADVVCGSGPHCLALERVSGRLYCWGHNGYGQLGNGGTNQLLAPAPCAGLDGFRVLAVACGANHSLALVAAADFAGAAAAAAPAEDKCDGGGGGGEVYAWGQNNYGQVGCGAAAATQATPRRVGGSLAARPARLVACCQASSFAVDELGEIHAWGFNGSGQLGTGGCANQPLPCRLEAPRAPVTRLSCGASHVLAATSAGSAGGARLWAWGANSHGQLGTGGKANSASPVAVALPTPSALAKAAAVKTDHPQEADADSDVGAGAALRILDVGAVHYSNLSVALVAAVCGQVGEGGGQVVFAWGQCRCQSLPAPVETRFETLNDAFACLSCPPVTCRRLELPSCSSDAAAAPTVAESVRRAFDDPATSDVTFRVDGRDIRAHRALLRIRCRHFRSMLADDSNWAESRQAVIPVQDYPYTVYRAFLEYLYTGAVSLPGEEYEATAVGLLDLANCYCEEQLKAQVQELVRRCVNFDSVLGLYAAAIRFSAPSLEKFCFQFAVRNLSRVVATESFGQLDEATLKQFMQLAAKAGAFKY